MSYLLANFDTRPDLVLSCRPARGQGRVCIVRWLDEHIPHFETRVIVMRYRNFTAKVAVFLLACFVSQTARVLATDYSKDEYLKRRHVYVAPGAGKGSAVDLEGFKVIGDPEHGFGPIVEWDRKDKQILLVCYVNAADYLGPAVLNLKKGDRVEVVEATGLASFSASDGKMAQSIIAIATKAADAAGTAVIGPEAVPIIEAGGKLAADNFGQPSTGDNRDAYGYDQGELKRQEGGILVCMPEASGVFYSGSDRDRWIKGDDEGKRTDDRLPEHMRGSGAFFPIPRDKAQNTRFAKSDGILNIIAWDFDFKDNSGFYRVIIRITQGTGDLEAQEVAELRKTLGQMDKLQLKRALESATIVKLKWMLEAADKDTLKYALQGIDAATLKGGLQVVDAPTLKVGLEVIDKETLKGALQSIDLATLKVAVKVIDDPTLKVGLQAVNRETLKSMLSVMNVRARPHALRLVDEATRQVAKELGY
jgi:hypothetical protein